jgi:hypothetical protein
MEYSELNRTVQIKSVHQLRNTNINNITQQAMSLLSRVIGFVAGEAICGSGNHDESFTGTGIGTSTGTGGRVNQRAKATLETGIQVGVSRSKAEKKEQMRHLRLTKSIQRLRATVAAQARTCSSISRLTSEAEDYHIGKTISKLFKPEKARGISEEHTCCVCLDSIYVGNTNITRTSCGHVFHLTCLLKSLKVKNTCPMCRWELEDKRPNQQAPNVLTPVSAEQIISEEIGYFNNAAHTQTIMLSRRPKRELKHMLRVFGLTLLRTVAEYIHEDNMPPGWFDDGDTTDDSEDSADNEEESENEDNGDNTDNADNTDNTDNTDNEEESENEASADNGHNADNGDNADNADPEPYSDENAQISDTRGSRRNLLIIRNLPSHAHWRQSGSAPYSPPHQNEDLRESLNRMNHANHANSENGIEWNEWHNI